MLAYAVVLVASALAAPSPSSGAAIAAYLVPTDEAVLGEEFSAAKVEKTLRDRLTRRSALKLVDEPERGGMRVQVTGCARAEEVIVKRERPADPPPIKLPHTRGTLIREEEYGVSAENRTFVVLSVRVVWGDEVQDIASGDADLTLEAAATTVAKEIEKLVKRKRRD